jgi:hypothetical protein
MKNIAAIESKRFILNNMKSENYSIVDLFARDATWMSSEYYKICNNIIACEKDKKFHADLLKNLKYYSENYELIDDAYSVVDNTFEIKQNIILIDNPMSAHGDHFEHFSIIKDSFLKRISQDRFAIIFNVKTSPNPYTLVWKKEREKFYGRLNIEIDTAVKFYIDRFESLGKQVHGLSVSERIQEENLYLFTFVLGKK